MLCGISICLCSNLLPGRCSAAGGLQTGSSYFWCGTLGHIPEGAEQTLFTKRYVCIPTCLKASRRLTQSTVLFWLLQNSLIVEKRQAFWKTIVRQTNNPQPVGAKHYMRHTIEQWKPWVKRQRESFFFCKIEVFKGTPVFSEFRHTHAQGRMPSQKRREKALKLSPLADLWAQCKKEVKAKVTSKLTG